MSTDIAILVFDEGTPPLELLLGRLSIRYLAHHCAKNHPASRIMKGFYHPCRKRSPDQLPVILGLTASPIVNSKIGGLECVYHRITPAFANLN